MRLRFLPNVFLHLSLLFSLLSGKSICKDSTLHDAVLRISSEVAEEKLCRDSLIFERVRIPNGKVVLDGLLVLPNLPGKKTVVIFLGGSGEWEIVDSYLKNPEESYGSLTRFYIEVPLVRRGVGMLYLNKRGIGQSTGHWKKSGIEDRASDALAAFTFLQSHPQINPHSIGMLGHSQGGWVAQLAASQNPQVAFSIAFAGPSMSVYDQTILNDEYFYKCEGLSPGKSRRKKFFKKIELGLGGAVGKIIGGEAGHWARMRKYNHDEALRNHRRPTLFVFGKHDIFVPCEENINHLAAIFPLGIPSQVTVRVADNIDHTFHIVDRPCLPWNEAVKNPFSTELREFLVAWISARMALNDNRENE